MPHAHEALPALTQCGGNLALVARSPAEVEGERGIVSGAIAQAHERGEVAEQETRYLRALAAAAGPPAPGQGAPAPKISPAVGVAAPVAAAGAAWFSCRKGEDLKFGNIQGSALLIIFKWWTF